jgi:hypothetical protein
MRGSIALALGLLAVAVPRGAGAAFDVPSSCDEDRDCAPYADNPWCHPDGYCWSCSEGDCTGVDEECREGACVVPCVDDIDCPTAEPTCEPQSGQCVECIDGSGCLESEYCSVGLCLPDVCSEGETTCRSLGSAVVVCNAQGSGWNELEPCDEDCAIVDGEAQCVPMDPDGTSDGATTADGTTGDATTGGFETGASADAGGTGEPASPNDSSSSRGCRIGPGSFGAWWLLVVVAARRTRRSRIGTGR